MDESFNFDHGRPSSRRHSGRPLYDERAANDKLYFYGGILDPASTELSRNSDSVTDTTVVLRPEFESSIGQNLQLQQPSGDSFAGLNPSVASIAAFPGEALTGEHAQEAEAPINDFSAEGFNATLRDREMGFGSDEFANNNDAGYYVPESGYSDVLPRSQGVDSATGTQSAYSFSPFGSYDAQLGVRQLLGLPQTSSTTIPSSAGTSTYAGSEILSDQGYDFFPNFGQSQTESKSFTLPPYEARTSVGGNNEYSSSYHNASGYPTNHATSSRNSWHVQTPKSYGRASLSSFIALPHTVGDYTSSAQTDLLAPSAGDSATYVPSSPGWRSGSFSTFPQTSSSQAASPSRPRLRSSSTSAAAQRSPFLGTPQKMRRSPSRRSRNRNSATLTPQSAFEGHLDRCDIGESPQTMLSSDLRLIASAQKGRRTGRMTEEGKAGANKSRREKETCIPCKLKKVRCRLKDGCRPCGRCAPKGGCCVRYEFNEFTKGDLLDFIAYFYLNHPSNFGPRSWLRLSPRNNLAQLSPSIQQLQQHASRIRFCLGDRILYDIDIFGCSTLLEALSQTDDSDQSSISSFYKSMDKAGSDLAGDGWVSFNDGLDNGSDENLSDISRMIFCTEMTAWHTFYISDLQTGRDRSLDPANPSDEPLLQAAALLSRLVSYKLECAGYKQLHSRLCDMGQKRTPITPELLQRLGQLLLSLRRRHSIWETLPVSNGSADKVKFVFRATEVCRILYFHYLQARGPCPSTFDRQSSETVWSDLFGCFPHDEFLPSDETPEGFESWLREGASVLFIDPRVMHGLQLSAFWPGGHFGNNFSFDEVPRHKF